MFLLLLLCKKKAMVSPITCHILDTTLGAPAAGVKCEISYLNNNETNEPFAVSHTDSDGRVKSWSEIGNSLNNEIKFTDGEWLEQDLKVGVFKIRFHTKDYFKKANRVTFFPFVDIIFEVPDNFDKHYHVPLLLSNYGYSTYRGS